MRKKCADYANVGARNNLDKMHPLTELEETDMPSTSRLQGVMIKEGEFRTICKQTQIFERAVANELNVAT